MKGKGMGQETQPKLEGTGQYMKAKKRRKKKGL